MDASAESFRWQKAIRKNSRKIVNKDTGQLCVWDLWEAEKSYVYWNAEFPFDFGGKERWI